MRSAGLAARYVSGYLLTRPADGQARLVGADASHAWAAIYCPGYDFIDLDPTNNVLVTVEHPTLAWGRDFGDVSPVGLLFGSPGGSERPWARDLSYVVLGVIFMLLGFVLERRRRDLTPQ